MLLALLLVIILATSPFHGPRSCEMRMAHGDVSVSILHDAARRLAPALPGSLALLVLG